MVGCYILLSLPRSSSLEWNVAFADDDNDESNVGTGNDVSSACPRPRLGKGNLARWNPRLETNIRFELLFGLAGVSCVSRALRVLALLLPP